MSIVVGTLTIDLTANTASFSQSMDKMSQLSAKTANDIKRSLEKIAAAGLAMGAAIATGTATLIEGSIDAADKMGKLAQSTGTTAETLSVLTYAAKLSGVETEKLGIGLTRLSLAAFKAQNGNVQLQNIFARLGVSATDSNGKLKDSGVLMEQLAVKFSGAADGAGKTALAVALFGKSGASLIPMLNQYGAEQARVNAEAHQFGLVLSTSTTEVAAKAHDNLMRLQEVLRGVGFAVLSSTLPSLVGLSEKLIDIAKDADIPDLAKAFGEKVVTAVTLLGNALEFAERHAHALKIALEGLVALGALKIAIPIIGDLAAGGIGKLGDGISRAVIGLLGLSRVLPTLAKFGTWALETAQFVGLLATEEGLASAAAYVLGGAVAFVGGPIGVVAAAIVGLGVALYKFRDATFSLKGSTYELRDVWSAAWILMGKSLTFVKSEFGKLVDGMRSVWTAFAGWFSANWIVTAFESAFGRALEFARGILGRLVPQFAIDALNHAKFNREHPQARAGSSLPEAPPAPKPTLDTTGLGPPKKDAYAEEIRKLDEAIAAQKAYLAVLDGTPEKIAEVAAAEKAQAVILELNNKLLGEGKPALNAIQQATISQKVALEESTKAMVEYGKELVGQQHGADLAIQQTRALAAANLQGDEAVRRATIDNAILGLTYNRTAEQIRTMTPELAKLRAELTAKANIETVAGANKEVEGLRNELAQREIVTAATLGSIDAQRQASLASKLYVADQNIANTTDAEARAALLAKRDALIELTKAEWAANDAEAARALLSPTEEYARSTDSLNHAVEALRELQGGTLTYGQELQIAAKQQDEFNKATDATIELLLKEGSMGDGITAFFLKMQEQAKTAAATIYDVLNETFNKLSDDLTNLITAPNRWKRRDAENAFAGTFENIGKNLLDSQIKTQLQSGLGALGKVFGVNLGSATGKVDGSTSSNALWVRWATATGAPVTGAGSAVSTAASTGSNELDDLLGAPPAPQSTFPSTQSGIGQAASVLGGATRGQPGPVGVFGGLVSALGGLFSRSKANQGALGGETLGLPSDFSGGSNELDDLVPPAVAAIPTLLRRDQGDLGDDSSIANPPDVQPKPYTLITRPQPSALDQVLQSVIGAGTKMLGGGGSSGGGSGAADTAGSVADDTSDDVSDLFDNLAGGGHVRGPGTGTSDSILARLSHGEFVAKAAQTRKYLPLLHAINNDTLRFAMGGPVGFDDGGYVSPSAAYLPASSDFGAMSRRSSQIAGDSSRSASRSSGDTHNWTINAQGSNDPAQITAQLDRYMRAKAPQIAAAAMHGVKDQQLRRAPSAR